MIASFLAAVLFYAAPVGAGFALCRGPAWRLPDRWIAGSLALTGIIALASLAPRPLFSWIVCTLTLALMAVGAHSWWRHLRNGNSEDGLPASAWVAAFASSLAALSIFRHQSPYPSVLNWDLFEHLVVSRAMVNGEAHLLLGAYTDTFTLETYTPIYHVLLAIPELLSPGLDPAGYYWFLDGLHNLAAALAGAFLGWRATRSAGVACWSGAGAAFLFESFVAYSAFFHMPQNLAGLFFTVTLATLLGGHRPGAGRLVLWATFLSMMHYFVGPVGALVLLGVAAGMGGTVTSPIREQRRFLLLFLALLGLCVMVSIWHAELRFDPFGTAESVVFNLPITDRLAWIAHWYGFGPLVLTIPVIALTLRGGRATRIMGALSFFFLLVAIAPVPYTFKFITLAHGIFASVSGLVLHTTLAAIRPRAARFVSASAFVATLGFLLAANDRLEVKRWIRTDGVATLLSPDEREAARFLSARYGFRGAFLVSDPGTQHVLEGLSGVETQGGGYANEATRSALRLMGGHEDADAMADAALNVRDLLPKRSSGPRLIALGGRFFAWQRASAEEQSSISFNIWRPRPMSPAERRVVDRLAMSPRFLTLFRNESLAILEVRPR